MGKDRKHFGSIRLAVQVNFHCTVDLFSPMEISTCKLICANGLSK